MALLQLTTDAGSMSVSAIDGQGFHVHDIDGQPVPTSCVVSAAEPSATGAITLAPTRSAYTVKPTDAVQLSLDAAAIRPVARFQLLLDFNDGVQSVTFSDNFKWNGAAPEITAKGIHVIDTIYMNVDGNDAFTGNYTGIVKKPIDMNGLVVHDYYGVLMEELCQSGELGVVTITGDDANPLAVSVGSNVNAQSLTFASSPAPGYCGSFTLNEGAVVGLCAVQCGWRGSITAGHVELLQLTTPEDDERLSDSDVTISGGTVDRIYYQSVLGGYTTLNVSGGSIGTIDSGDYGLNISGSAVVDILNAHTYETISITGGTVNTVNAIVDFDSAGTGIAMSNCVVNTFITAFGTESYGYLYYTPEIGEGVVLNRLDISTEVGEDEIFDAATISVGANSTVKLSRSTQALIASGKLTINADSTATIINLED